MVASEDCRGRQRVQRVWMGGQYAVWSMPTVAPDIWDRGMLVPVRPHRDDRPTEMIHMMGNKGVSKSQTKG